MARITKKIQYVNQKKEHIDSEVYYAFYNLKEWIFKNQLFCRLKFEFQFIYNILIASTVQIGNSIAQFLIGF